MDKDLLGGAGTKYTTVYSETKFVQLLGAHWWRRQLKGAATVVAVSPGLIPGTGLGRNSGFKLSMDMPDAKTVPEGESFCATSPGSRCSQGSEGLTSAGAANLLRALSVDDFPADPEQIFLTSWGEWWPKDVYANSLDQGLQDKWSPTREEIEREEGLA